MLGSQSLKVIRYGLSAPVKHRSNSGCRNEVVALMDSKKTLGRGFVGVERNLGGGDRSSEAGQVKDLKFVLGG